MKLTKQRLKEIIKEVHLSEGYDTDQQLHDAFMAKTKELQNVVIEALEGEEMLNHLDYETKGLIAARAVSALRRVVPGMDI